VGIEYLAINPNPLIMIFSIAFKNSSAIIYSIPYKVIYNEYKSCLDSTPVYAQLGLFPFMYIVGSK
jgi:hypothetical protein